jgi:hypothetical protein
VVRDPRIDTKIDIPLQHIVDSKRENFDRQFSYRHMEHNPILGCRIVAVLKQMFY